MAEAQRDQATLLALTDAAHERLNDAGACAPGNVEAGNRIAVTGGEIAATFGPLNNGEEANAQGMEPGTFLACGKGDIGFCPAAGPQIFCSIETGAAQPIL